MIRIPRRVIQMLPKAVQVHFNEYNELRYDQIQYTAAAKQALSRYNRPDSEDLFRAWFADFKKYRVSFPEYLEQYRFPERSEAEKAAYMTASVMRSIYRRKVDAKSRQRFLNKERFLEDYSEYIHREWLHVKPDSDASQIQQFLNRFDVIVKPLNGTHGQGVRKLPKGANPITEGLLGQELMMEQCVSGEATLQAFHPQSLNTIRIAMFTDGKSEVRTMWAVLRTGNNHSCIDNTHGGGISSLIDVNTGTIISDGQCDGKIYEKHPVSAIPFKGFRIPYWEDIIHICKEAAVKYENTYFVGWDVAVWDDGRIEFIEGNHGPDVDGVQTLLNHGLKPEILKTIKELHI